MKVLQILPALNQGGVEYYVLENCQHIAQYADSFVISSGGRLVETLVNNGSQHLSLPIERKNLKSLCQINQLTKIIKRIHPDIIHIHSRLQAWLVYFALKKLSHRPTIITTVHGINSVNRYSEQMLHADKVILVSHALKQHIIHSYPNISKERYIVIPQGINTQTFNNNAVISHPIKEQASELGIDLMNDRVLLLAGRITRIKGIPFLIQLMERFKSEGKTYIKAVIVGGYDDRNKAFFHEMQRVVRERNLEKQILWFGSSDDMTSIYRLADATLSLTTKPESYGRTVLESLACGTPVIGFDYGGVGENLQKFYPDGRIFPNDPMALYETVLKVLATPKADHKIFPVTDTIEQSQAKLKALYESLCTS